MAKAGTVLAMLERIRGINLAQEVGVIAGENLEEFTTLQKKQMMQGKNNKGELFAPKHSENPFFKTPAAGLRYAKWKQKLFPETPFDVANLIITGYYHDSISFVVATDTITAQSSASFAGNIDNTFQNTALGLDPESKAEVWTEVLRGPLVRTLAEKIGCGISG